jgi:hypothetical protein
VYEVNSVGSAISFLIWTLVVVALTKAIFGSFLAAEIGWWLHHRGAKRHEQIRRRQWEVQHGVKYDPDVVRGSPHAARQALSMAEVARRRAELVALARGTLLMRMVGYLAGCIACQSFWVALAMDWAAGVDTTNVVTDAFAYSGMAAILTLSRRQHVAGASAQMMRKRCANCDR